MCYCAFQGCWLGKQRLCNNECSDWARKLKHDLMYGFLWSLCFAAHILNRISTPPARLPRPFVWEVKRETATSCCLLKTPSVYFLCSSSLLHTDGNKSNQSSWKCGLACVCLVLSIKPRYWSLRSLCVEDDHCLLGLKRRFFFYIWAVLIRVWQVWGTWIIHEVKAYIVQLHLLKPLFSFTYSDTDLLIFVYLF